jgi:hypothetical protein
MSSDNAHRCAQDEENVFFAETYIECYHIGDDEFLHHIVLVTSGRMWVLCVDAETTEQSTQWTKTHSINKPKKSKRTLFPCQKVHCISDSGIHARSNPMTSQAYCEALIYVQSFRIKGVECWYTVQSPTMMIRMMCMTFARTRAVMDIFNWELFDYLASNTDLAPRD